MHGAIMHTNQNEARTSELSNNDSKEIKASERVWNTCIRVKVFLVTAIVWDILFPFPKTMLKTCLKAESLGKRNSQNYKGLQKVYLHG